MLSHVGLPTYVLKLVTVNFFCLCVLYRLCISEGGSSERVTKKPSSLGSDPKDISQRVVFDTKVHANEIRACSVPYVWPKIES